MNLPKLKADLRRITELVNQLDPLMDAIIANQPDTLEDDHYEAQSLQARGFDALKEGTEALQEWAERQNETYHESDD